MIDVSDREAFIADALEAKATSADAERAWLIATIIEQRRLARGATHWEREVSEAPDGSAAQRWAERMQDVTATRCKQILQAATTHGAVNT